MEAKIAPHNPPHNPPQFVTLQCAKLGGDSNILTSPTPRLSTLAMLCMCSDFSEDASFRRYE